MMSSVTCIYIWKTYRSPVTLFLSSLDYYDLMTKNLDGRTGSVFFFFFRGQLRTRSPVVMKYDRNYSVQKREMKLNPCKHQRWKELSLSKPAAWDALHATVTSHSHIHLSLLLAAAAFCRTTGVATQTSTSLEFECFSQSFIFFTRLPHVPLCNHC